jgi:hypothetical protein
MLDVYRVVNRILYHTNWTFTEIYNMPVPMREFIAKDLHEFLEEMNKKMEESAKSNKNV